MRRSALRPSMTLSASLSLLTVAALGAVATGRADGTPVRTVPVAATASVRLLPNPGLEAGTDSWTADTPSAVTVVTDPVHGGGSAVRIVDPAADAGISFRSAKIAVVPGEELTATAWVRRTAGTGGSLYVEFWRPDGIRAAATSVDAGTSTGWQQLTVSGFAPDEASTATVLAYSNRDSAGTTVWDDFAVSALPPP